MDLTYAEDGRTLKSAKLMDNASVDLPGQARRRRKARGRAHDRHRHGIRRQHGDGAERRGIRAGRSPGGWRFAGTTDPIGVAGRHRRGGRRLAECRLHGQRRFPRDARGERRAWPRSSAPHGRSGWTCRRSPVSGTWNAPTSAATCISPTAPRRAPTRPWRSTPSRRIVSSSRPRRPVIRVRGPTSRTDA